MSEAITKACRDLRRGDRFFRSPPEGAVTEAEKRSGRLVEQARRIDPSRSALEDPVLSPLWHVASSALDIGIGAHVSLYRIVVMTYEGDSLIVRSPAKSVVLPLDEEVELFDPRGGHACTYLSTQTLEIPDELARMAVASWRDLTEAEIGALHMKEQYERDRVGGDIFFLEERHRSAREARS